MNPTDAANVAAFLARQIDSSVGRPEAIASLQRVLDHLNAQIKRMVEPVGDGGPAFPRDHRHDGHNGMWLRDYFAARAMHAALTSEAAMQAFELEAAMNNGARGEQAVAEASYRMADEMLRARSS